MTKITIEDYFEFDDFNLNTLRRIEEVLFDKAKVHAELVHNYCTLVIDKEKGKVEIWGLTHDEGEFVMNIDAFYSACKHQLKDTSNE